MAQQRGSLDLNVKMAGVVFRSPVGVAAMGNNYWGRQLQSDPEAYVEAHAGVLLKHINAGAGYIYFTFASLTDTTIAKLHARARLEERHFMSPAGIGHRLMKAETPGAPYGLEGMYYIDSPFWIDDEFVRRRASAREMLMKILKERKPKDVPLICNVQGFSDLPDTWVDGARRAEELGADLIELNVSCPFPTTMRGAVEDFSQKRFSRRFQGQLIGGQPELVSEITGEVVKAVKIPVGVKLSPDTGFPQIIEVAKTIRDAGAKFIEVFNSAAGIAPPDIYNKGRPLWPFLDANPFCMISGSWSRMLCHRAVAAIARFVPGLDIAAAGGLVIPQHCIEVMMLGARLTQLCTGVIEQGRGFIRRTNEFIKKFMIEQDYKSVEEFIGLGQEYIKYSEEVDLMPGKLVAELDEEKCVKCGNCLNNICIALYSEKGKIKINQDRCTGCGGCIIACRSEALKLVLRDLSHADR